MKKGKSLAQQLKRFLKPAHWRRTVLRLKRSTIHVGNRSYCHAAGMDRLECVRKRFLANAVGRQCYQREILARQVFRTKPWIVPILRRGARWVDFERCPEHLRLDLLAPRLDVPTRFRIALEAIGVAFEIFYSGYAHRDFHAKNLFWLDPHLRVIDFEELEPYPPGGRPPFPESFDLVGSGLPDSGFGGDVMCYTAQTVEKVALQEVLGIPLDEALAAFKETLKDDLRMAGGGGAQNGPLRKSPTCLRKLDCSFELPFFAVPPNEAEWDGVTRTRALRMEGGSLAGRRLLVLGERPAGLLFCLQQFKPAFSVGVARAPGEAEAGSRIAAYCGLRNIQLIQEGKEPFTAQDLGGPFDMVIHTVNNGDSEALARDSLWLSALTRDVLYLETPSSQDFQDLPSILRHCGFQSVECLGTVGTRSCPQPTCQWVFTAKKA